MTTLIQTKTATATASALTVTLDTAPIVGSILLLVGNSTQGIGTPAGWTLRASFVGDQGFYIWDKVSAGAADMSIVLTPNLSATVAGTLVELSGVDINSFDVVSTVNGTSGVANIPINGVASTDINGALLLAIGAVHGWSVAPANPPTYTGGWVAASAALPTGVGATLVGHYLGVNTTSAAGNIGGTNIGTAAAIDNTAGFLIAYSRTPPIVIVPITAVNSATGWTLTGAASALAAMTDGLDTSFLTSGDTPVNLLLDVQLGALAKPPGNFTCRVRAKKVATTAGIVGRLYNGSTLLSTAASVSPPTTAFDDRFVTFPAGDLTAVSAATWAAGLRLTLSASAT